MQEKSRICEFHQKSLSKLFIERLFRLILAKVKVHEDEVESVKLDGHTDQCHTGQCHYRGKMTVHFEYDIVLYRHKL